MATLPGGQTVGANQVNLGTATAPNIQTTQPAPVNQVLTQGQQFTDSAGRTGTVNYDSATGAKLTSGQTTNSVPTSVVGPGPATTQYNNMASAAQTATAAQQNQAIINKQNANNPLTPFQNNSPTGVVVAPAQTPEDKIANAPDEGMQEAYNSQTGQRQDQPVGPLKQGFTAQNPNARTDVVASASGGQGITIKQFSDGTYGRFDASGNYTSPATQGDFAQANMVSSTAQNLANLQNGIYTPAQQNQITAIQQGYVGLIAQQQQANANSVGATTIAENLYGMGNTLGGQGQITQAINAGVTKVAALQAKMNSDISALNETFLHDDTDAAKNAFDEYSSDQAAIQKNLDDIQTRIQDAKNYQLEQDKFNEQKDNDAFTQKMDSDKFTYQQKQDAIQNKLAAGTLSLEKAKYAETLKDDLRNFNAQYGGLLDPSTGLLKSGQTLDSLGTQTQVPGIGSVTDTGSPQFKALPKAEQNLIASNSTGGIVIDSSTDQGKNFLAAANELQVIDQSGSDDQDSMNARQIGNVLKGSPLIQQSLDQELGKKIPGGANMTVGQAKAYLQNQMATAANVPIQAIKYAGNPDLAKSDLQDYYNKSSQNADQINIISTAHPEYTPLQILQIVQQ